MLTWAMEIKERTARAAKTHVTDKLIITYTVRVIAVIAALRELSLYRAWKPQKFTRGRFSFQKNEQIAQNYVSSLTMESYLTGAYA